MFFSFKTINISICFVSELNKKLSHSIEILYMYNPANILYLEEPNVIKGLSTISVLETIVLT